MLESHEFTADSAHSSAGISAERLGMIITPDRVIYRGLLGVPSCRALGAFTLYVAQQTPFEIRRENGPAQGGFLAIASPNERHWIHSADRVIGVILIEPECATVADALALAGVPVTRMTPEYTRLHTAFAQWRDDNADIAPTTDEVDRFFFGRPLTARRLDNRITRIVRQIRAQPCEQFLARECAKLTGLSFSRFVHLFREEIGMTFRTYCAWKRARAVLPHVTCPCTVTDLAFCAGYPDSTHFSHSMRRIFGLRPRDILSGSQRIALRYEVDESDRTHSSLLRSAVGARPKAVTGFAPGRSRT